MKGTEQNITVPKITSKLVHVKKVLLLTFCWCFIFFLIIIRVIYGTHQSTQFYGLNPQFLQQVSSDGTTHTNDHSLELSTVELLKLSSKISNLPLEFFADSNRQQIHNSSCSKYPNTVDLDFNNIYWQKLTTGDATFYLYGAYFDDRLIDPVVRIIAMVNRVKPPQVLCQLWYKNPADERLISKTSYTYIWLKTYGNYKDGILQPFIITCPISGNGLKIIPSSVSLIEKCDHQMPTNILRVVNNRPEKRQDVAVCVKGLDFLYEDISLRLVEWFELLNILGAKKIFVYELQVHPNISKVLSYYAKRGIVESTPITLPGGQPNFPVLQHLYLEQRKTHKRQNELIPYNDCLYKNLYSYDYLVLLDTDEVIMPLQHDSWKDMMQELVKPSQKRSYQKGNYCFRHYYFLDNVVNKDNAVPQHAFEEGIPKYLYMLQHVHRSEIFAHAGDYVKCFNRVDQVVSVHNHFPYNCFGQCKLQLVDKSLAYLQHYRKDCIETLKKECIDYRSNTVKDTAIWRYKDELIRRTSMALSDLGFI